MQKRIITIEEPVEYELKGINQIAVRSDIGLTFAMGCAHILRQDPNVIMVGEIRDLETAEIAIRAALTGHLVFSTLHTNDAPSAFTRLIDMGIEPFLVASSVEAVMAQRLVRTICPYCKTEQKLEHDYLKRIGFPEHEFATAKIYKGRGCERCRLTRPGRMGIYEILILNEALRPLILNRSAASTIAQKAIEQGMRTLRTDGWNKVKAGQTTIEEVLRNPDRGTPQVARRGHQSWGLGEDIKWHGGIPVTSSTPRVTPSISGNSPPEKIPAPARRKAPAHEPLPDKLIDKDWQTPPPAQTQRRVVADQPRVPAGCPLPKSDFEETRAMVDLQLEKLSPSPSRKSFGASNCSRMAIPPCRPSS